MSGIGWGTTRVCVYAAIHLRGRPVASGVRSSKRDTHPIWMFTGERNVISCQSRYRHPLFDRDCRCYSYGTQIRTFQPFTWTYRKTTGWTADLSAFFARSKNLLWTIEFFSTDINNRYRFHNWTSQARNWTTVLRPYINYCCWNVAMNGIVGLPGIFVCQLPWIHRFLDL